MKSQRPSRRKQAVQVARPTTWPSSACQPKRARARAGMLLLMREGCVVVVSAGGFGGLDGVVEGGSGEGGWKRGASFCEIEGRSKSSGVEVSGGISEAMATRDM